MRVSTHSGTVLRRTCSKAGMTLRNAIVCNRAGHMSHCIFHKKEATGHFLPVASSFSKVNALCGMDRHNYVLVGTEKTLSYKDATVGVREVYLNGVRRYFAQRSGKIAALEIVRERIV